MSMVTNRLSWLQIGRTKHLVIYKCKMRYAIHHVDIYRENKTAKICRINLGKCDGQLYLEKITFMLSIVSTVTKGKCLIGHQEL